MPVSRQVSDYVSIYNYVGSYACREAGEPGKARNYFPQDKQYLVTRGGELQLLLACPWVLC
jgi:hypothetical protein